MKSNRSVLRAKLERAREQFPHLPRAFALVWAAARGWTIAWVILLILQGILPAVSVSLTRRVIDALVAALAVQGDWQVFFPALVLSGLLAGTMLLAELSRGLTGWIRTVQAELVEDHINSLIHSQSIALDLAFYEVPEYYDSLYRARAEASYRPAALVENFGGLLQNGVSLLGMGAILLPYGLWLPLALLVSTLPAFYVVLRYAVRQHEWRLRVTSHERRTWYYDWILTAAENAAELRLFGLGGRFSAVYQEVRERLRKERLGLFRDRTLAEVEASLLALLVTGASLLWMLWRAMQGLATLGDLALFYQAFTQGQSLMRSLLQNLAEIYSNSLYLGNLFQFLELAPKIVAPAHPVPVPPIEQRGIRLQDVSFRYPGSGRTALDRLNLAIEPGQLVAIVGPNGAGKTTLAKLLCRLYDPDEGCIEWEGVDLRSFSPAELRRRIGVLFQDPVHYSATVAENISSGDGTTDPKREGVERAAANAEVGETVAHLPQGLDTLLGKWFENGTEISTGEWQRVALGRALYRDSSLLILDEPTSAMDPWTEAEWLARLPSVTRGRITMIITHRLTTAVCADVIHVMQDGRVVESGDHRTLLAKGGRYAELWKTAGPAAG